MLKFVLNIEIILEKITRVVIRKVATILDINYVDFLQFQRYFRPQAELEEAFIYIIRKPIDFSIDFSCRLKTYGHMVIGFKQVRVPIGT